MSRRGKKRRGQEERRGEEKEKEGKRRKILCKGSAGKIIKT